MLDLYVAGRGVISDVIDATEESLIGVNIEEKIAKNETLHEQLREFKRDGRENQADFSSILRYCDEPSWSDYALSVQDSYNLRQ